MFSCCFKKQEENGYKRDIGLNINELESIQDFELEKFLKKLELEHLYDKLMELNIKTIIELEDKIENENLMKDLNLDVNNEILLKGALKTQNEKRIERQEKLEELGIQEDNINSNDHLITQQNTGFSLQSSITSFISNKSNPLSKQDTTTAYDYQYLNNN